MDRFTVVVAEPIHPAGIEVLREGKIEILQLPQGSDEALLVQEVSRADGLITRGYIRVSRDLMEASPNLRVIGVHGVGYDHVDIQAAEDLGKIVFHTPSALTETVAELTLALMLSLIRNVVRADGAIRAGEWARKYQDLIGSEIMGKTIGIVGLGRIGSAVAHRLKPFEVELLYSDIVRKEELEHELGIRRVDLDVLFKTSDIITLHVPLTPLTKGLISYRELEMMKDRVFIVNMARGEVMDQRALIQALRSGKVAGAALDVFEEEPIDPLNPLVSMDKVILTPHIGASTVEALRRMAIQAANGVIEVLRGGVPDNPVVI
jgi:D-3-phosphoglycerate dehydrogenase